MEDQEKEKEKGSPGGGLSCEVQCSDAVPCSKTGTCGFLPGRTDYVWVVVVMVVIVFQ